MGHDEFRPDTRKAFARIKRINQQHDFVLFYDPLDQIPPHDSSTQLLKLFNRLGLQIHAFDIRTDEEIWDNIQYYDNFVYNSQLHVKGTYVFHPADVMETHEEGNFANWLEFFTKIKLK